MNPDPVWSLVNWVHLSNGEALSVQRLGVRYRLHPLVVEDLAFHENRAKVDKYKTHMLITVPFLSYRRFDDASYHALFSHTKKGNALDSANPTATTPTLLQLVPSLLSSTALTPRLDNTRSRHFTLEENTIEVAHKQSITDLTNNADTHNAGLHHLEIQPFNIVFIFTNPWAKSSQGVISVTSEEKEDLWDYIYKLLKSKNNRGKSEGGSYLVYALLDYVVCDSIHF